MQIAIKRSIVYGNQLIYVCDKTQAGILRELTGKKTVDRRDLENLQKLGHTILDCDAEIAKIVKG